MNTRVSGLKISGLLIIQEGFLIRVSLRTSLQALWGPSRVPQGFLWHNAFGVEDLRLVKEFRTRKV